MIETIYVDVRENCLDYLLERMPAVHLDKAREAAIQAYVEVVEEECEARACVMETTEHPADLRGPYHQFGNLIAYGTCMQDLDLLADIAEDATLAAMNAVLDYTNNMFSAL